MKLPKLNKQQQMYAGIGVVGALVLSFLYYRFYWSPISQKIAEYKAKIEQVEGKIQKAKVQAARQEILERELVVLRTQTAEAEERLPKDKDVPAVIDTVSRLARKHKVDLQTFSPGSPAAKQFFIEAPYAVTVVGTYHEIGLFLAAVALEKRIFNVRNVNYSLGPASASRVSPLSVSFTLISYQYKQT